MQFYVLGDLRTDDWTYHADGYGMKPKNQGDAPECPVCGECIGMLPWLPPYHAEIMVHGKKLGDLVRCIGPELLVSERFRHAWEQEKLGGIEVFSPLVRVRIRPARLGRRPLTYFHVTPRYCGTKIDVEKSVIDFSRGGTCKQCHGGMIDSVRGFAIDESSWSGEDLFKPWGMPGKIVVTDRVRQMRDKYELTNINLTRVEEFLWDPEKRWTPYCWYLPDGFTPPETAEIETGTSN